MNARETLQQLTLTKITAENQARHARVKEFCDTVVQACVKAIETSPIVDLHAHVVDGMGNTLDNELFCNMLKGESYNLTVEPINYNRFKISWK